MGPVFCQLYLSGFRVWNKTDMETESTFGPEQFEEAENHLLYLRNTNPSKTFELLAETGA